MAMDAGQAPPHECPHLCRSLRQQGCFPSAGFQFPLQGLLSLLEGVHLALSCCGSRKCCIDLALQALALRLQRAQALCLLLLRLALQPLYVALTCTGIAPSGHRLHASGAVAMNCRTETYRQRVMMADSGKPGAEDTHVAALCDSTAKAQCCEAFQYRLVATYHRP